MEQRAIGRRPPALVVAAIIFGLVALGLAELLTLDYRDPCPRLLRGTAGSEGMGAALLMLMGAAVAAAGVALLMVAALLVTGRRPAALYVLSASLGVVAALLISMEIADWRLMQTSQAACLAALPTPPPTPPNVPAEVSLDRAVP